ITLVLGGPGSGKGTQSTRLATEFGMAHLSTGELLRQQVASGTELGGQIEGLISRGRLVPDPIVVGVLQAAVKDIVRAGNAGKGILLDGFPRTLAQAKLFEECVGAPRTVVFFDAPPEMLRARLGARGRGDDTEAVIEERLRLHAVETPSVVEFYRQGGVLAGTRAT
ncbi:adenylate kinase, partial [Fimicolochytrium jonesii]|uniref:adenylate kinase n=1 Tax=Fimicolochytrium jonesii TaxID=1396493 RepID=UPI0022FDFCD9